MLVFGKNIQNLRFSTEWNGVVHTMRKKSGGTVMVPPLTLYFTEITR